MRTALTRFYTAQINAAASVGISPRQFAAATLMLVIGIGCLIAGTARLASSLPQIGAPL